MRSLPSAVVFITLATSYLATGVCSRDATLDLIKDVCIIGGGSAGIFAAIQLLDSGKSVVVVEASRKPGGHTDTYTDPDTGISINAGVQSFTSTTIVQNYFARLGVPLVAASPPPPGNLIYVDFHEGKVDSNFTMPSPTTLRSIFQRYGALLQSNYSYLANGYSLPYPVPNNLLVSFEAFALKNALEDALFLLNLQTQPNQILRETAIYTLKTFDLLVLAAVANPKLIVSAADNGQLYSNAAQILGKDILLGTTVEALSRSPCGVQLSVRGPDNSRKTIKAKKLLMAVPPTLENMRGWDITRQEHALFSKWQANRYMVGVFSNKGIPAGTKAYGVGLDSPYKIPKLPGISILSPTRVNGTFVAYFVSESPLSVELSQAIFLKQLRRLAVAEGWQQAETIIHAWYDHSPIKLHVGPEEINGGFYNDINALQGQKSTWWTGAAWQSQASVPIWTFTQEIIRGWKW